MSSHPYIDPYLVAAQLRLGNSYELLREALDDLYSAGVGETDHAKGLRDLHEAFAPLLLGIMRLAQKADDTLSQDELDAFHAHYRGDDPSDKVEALLAVIDQTPSGRQAYREWMANREEE